MINKSSDDIKKNDNLYPLDDDDNSMDYKFSWDEILTKTWESIISDFSNLDIKKVFFDKNLYNQT